MISTYSNIEKKITAIGIKINVIKINDEIKKFHTGRNLRCSVLQRTAFQAIFACVLPYILLNFFCCVFDPAKFYLMKISI